MARPLTRLALQFSGPRRVEIIEEAVPPPPPGHVVARTMVSAISAGTELLAFRGELPPDLPRDEKLGALAAGTFAYPFRYGYASVGEVIATGEGVDRAWVGRRVFGFVPHATMFTAWATDVVTVPDDISSERAALLAHMETAVSLVLDGAPRLGENVLVIGQGTVGLLVSALLGRFPLGALAVSDRRQMRATLGRVFTVDASTFATKIVADADEAGRAFGPRGADLVYELSGNPEALELAIAAAGHEARIVVGSWYGQKRAAIDLGGRFHRRRLRLISSQVSHIGGELAARWDHARRFDTAWSALWLLDPLPLVSHRIPFAEAQAAYQHLDRGSDGVLQVLLTYPGS